MVSRVRLVGAVALTAVLATAGLAGCNRNEATQPARTQVGDRGTPSSSGSPGGGYGDRGSYDRGSARADRGDRSERSDRGGAYSGGSSYNRDRADARPREAIPDFKGKPMWSDNRRHSAQENAQYHFEHDGADLGAKTLDDYLTKVHAFVDSPPAGAETLSRRNGDKLIYDPKTNMFAVARKDGAPRTAFKPRDGADYWKKQQARIEDEKNGRGSSYGGGERRSSRSDRDDG